MCVCVTGEVFSECVCVFVCTGIKKMCSDCERNELLSKVKPRAGSTPSDTVAVTTVDIDCKYDV